MTIKKVSLRQLTGRTFRSKDDITDYASSIGLYAVWSEELNRIVQSRKNYSMERWSPRSTFLSEYKDALINILNGPEKRQ